jgi:hypothetical protein
LLRRFVVKPGPTVLASERQSIVPSTVNLINIKFGGFYDITLLSKICASSPLIAGPDDRPATEFGNQSGFGFRPHTFRQC